MMEPTTEDKIQLLVRSVLEAVDARLDAVRHEIATFSNDVEQRHHHLLESMAALDARVTELAHRPAASDGGPDLARLTADVDALRERVESLASHTPPPTAPSAPLAAAPAAPLAAPVVEAVAATEPEPAHLATHQITREELDEISRPFVTRVTTQVPVVPDPSGHHEAVEHMPLRVPPVVAPHFGTATDESAEPSDGAASGDDEIDLDQLASLLNARLGSLSLPTRQD